MTFGEIFTIRCPNFNRIQIRIIFDFEKSPEYEYYSVLKNHPNTNTNIIQFWKITRIRIRILFSFVKSPEYEYEYEYHYSVSTIRILFEYRIIRSPLISNQLLRETEWQQCARETHFREIFSLADPYLILHSASSITHQAVS